MGVGKTIDAAYKKLSEDATTSNDYATKKAAAKKVEAPKEEKPKKSASAKKKTAKNTWFWYIEYRPKSCMYYYKRKIKRAIYSGDFR